MTKFECGVVLFHGTTKENLKKILKEGIKPGGGKGFTKLAQEANLLEGTKEDIERLEKRSKEKIYFTGSLDTLEKYNLKEMGIDIVLIVGLPQEKLYIEEYDMSFQEWNEQRHKKGYWEEISGLTDIFVKETIPVEYILRILEIKEYAVRPNLGRYIINYNDIHRIL